MLHQFISKFYIKKRLFHCKCMQKLVFKASKFFRRDDYKTQYSWLSFCYRVPLVEKYSELCLNVPFRKKERWHNSADEILSLNCYQLKVKFLYLMTPFCGKVLPVALRLRTFYPANIYLPKVNNENTRKRC